MPSFFLITTLYFLFVALTSPVSETANPFITYFNIQTRFIQGHSSYFILGFIVISILFFYLESKRKSPLYTRYVRFIGRIIVTIFGGSIVSLILLFVIALIEINLLSVITYLSPKLLGVETDSQVIYRNLEKSNHAPLLIAGGSDRNILPLTIAVAQSGKNSFYGGRIIPYMPSFLIYPGKINNAGVMMLGSSLIINELNSDAFQKISPVVSYLVIKDYLPKTTIKSYPRVTLMNKEEYLIYRKLDFDDKLKKYDEVIGKISLESESLAEEVENIKNQITESDAELKKISVQKEKEYIKCVNTGYYSNGAFVKTNSVSYCQEKSVLLENTIQDLRKKSDELKNALDKSQLKLSQYKQYEKIYSNQKVLTQEESGYVSFEFGTFNPPDLIKIALALKNDRRAIADYLELIIHEYLHYTRLDDSGKKFTTSFFEEGLTEYFARKIINDSLGTDTNMGYPVNIKIIEQMTKRIDENDFIDIFFNNDQEGLEKKLDLIYGKGFYKKNIVLFETIHFSSNSEQILNLANDIMSEIGGSNLTKDDLETTYSVFQ